ncbi:MAG: hypothetical protein U1E32_05285 [Rhodoglobus sp.]|nr:hypothetical protein [Rhodoglobus sp.]
MAADSAGNDITAVGIPITGLFGFAPTATTLPTATEGNDPDYELPVAFKRAGLLKVDGGPQFAWAASGDPIEFFQAGYSIPSGLADVTFTAAYAQHDPFIRELIHGVAPDANGMIIVDGGGHSIEKILWSEEIFANGDILRRCAPKTGVRTVTEDRGTRGEVKGYTVVHEIKRSSLISNKHFMEWLIPAA